MVLTKCRTEKVLNVPAACFPIYLHLTTIFSYLQAIYPVTALSTTKWAANCPMLVPLRTLWNCNTGPVTYFQSVHVFIELNLPLLALCWPPLAAFLVMCLSGNTLRLLILYGMDEPAFLQHENASFILMQLAKHLPTFRAMIYLCKKHSRQCHLTAHEDRVIHTGNNGTALGGWRHKPIYFLIIQFFTIYTPNLGYSAMCVCVNILGKFSEVNYLKILQITSEKEKVGEQIARFIF